jgi:uncharacterized membrane protein YedE/YeeE
MRIFGAALLATTLMVTSAIAAPLAPGKPAGVKTAQMMHDRTLLIIGGVAIVGLGIGLAASTGSSNGITSSTSASATATSTTP